MEGSNEQKWEDNKRKSIYSEMWGNAVRVLMGRGACENTVELSICESPTETIKYIWVNI